MQNELSPTFGHFRDRVALLAVAASLCAPLAAWAQAVNACDLNADGAVNILDVQSAVNMALGNTSCTATIAGPGVCNIIVVQRVTNTVLGGPCVVDHYVTLNWTASTSSNVTGYNIYRATVSGGPYTKLTATPVSATTYTDTAVQAGQTYYYVATAVDSSSNESTYSNEAQAVIPSS
jgi:hypothetical protein